MLSGPLWRPLPTIRRNWLESRNASGNEIGFPNKFVNSFLTINDCETVYAGVFLVVDINVFASKLLTHTFIRLIVTGRIHNLRRLLKEFTVFNPTPL